MRSLIDIGDFSVEELDGLLATAADIIKAAMVGVWQGLREKFPAARLLLTVHDELIVEAPAEQAEDVAAFVAAAMANAAQLSVRLDTDVHIGKTWFDTKE